MTNEQIIKKEIEKAIKNGWRDYAYDEVVTRSDGQIQLQSSSADLEPLRFVSINDIIFSHDFAKAFWGEENYPITEIEYGGHKVLLDKVWKARLQQMVLEKEPLKYLEKFL